MITTYLPPYVILALLLVVITKVAQPAFGQENYLPGYVISLPGDTISGAIDYRGWEFNPEEIHFKTTLKEEPIRYGPSDIRGFEVHDERYVSAVVAVEISSHKTGALSHSSEAVLETDTAFLQTLFAGSKSLHSYKNRMKEQFYIRQESEFELLVYKKYLKKDDRSDGLAENRKYLGQLAVYLQDCSVIQDMLRNTSYSRKALNRLFARYHECTSAPVSFEKRAEQVEFIVGAVVGGTLSILSFSGEGNAPLVAVEYPSSMNGSVGLSLEVVLPRNQRKWSFHNELLYTSYQTAGRYDDFTNEDRYTITRTELGYSYIKLNNLARFRYPVGKVALFVNVGISNGLVVGETNYRRTETKLYSTERVREEAALADSRRHEQGFLGGLGAQFGRFSLEARYERGNGMSAYTGLRSLTHRYYTLLGYRF